jgi:AP-1 complex subunit mu
MAVSAVFILDSKGKLLISRDFRGDIPVSCVDRFVNIITGARGSRGCGGRCWRARHGVTRRAAAR